MKDNIYKTVPSESLLEIHDSILLALDAINGNALPRNLTEAGSYLRAARRELADIMREARA